MAEGRRLAIVAVNWIDSVGDNDGWGGIDAFLRERPPVIQTVGILIDSAPDYIKLAHTVDTAGDECNGRFIIPRGCIVGEIEVLMDLPEVPSR